MCDGGRNILRQLRSHAEEAAGGPGCRDVEGAVRTLRSDPRGAVRDCRRDRCQDILGTDRGVRAGAGCDICKPVIASILASTSSDHILDSETAALQDTNDHFLANMQRNGTYSVVPRLPGRGHAREAHGDR